jgi:hypothetical protein
MPNTLEELSGIAITKFGKMTIICRTIPSKKMNDEQLTNFNTAKELGRRAVNIQFRHCKKCPSGRKCLIGKDCYWKNLQGQCEEKARELFILTQEIIGVLLK